MRVVFFVVVTIFLTGCSLTSTPREERHKMEMSLHNIRTEMEDIKHDLNSSEIELHILEGKLIDQDDAITGIKKQAVDTIHAKLNQLEDKLVSLERGLKSTQKQQDESAADLRKLATHANETMTALSQYRDKINELERYLEEQNRKVAHLLELKNTFETLTKELTQSEPKIYSVKEGDSLEKIAREHRVSISSLKKANSIENDLIAVGQKIIIPKRETALD